MNLSVSEIANIAHEVNRAYCNAIGDNSQLSWTDAPKWQKESAIAGVEFHLKHDATPEESHGAWLEQKVKDGWKYGVTKDVDLKEHPCFVPYNELPLSQRIKDYLFKSVIHATKE